MISNSEADQLVDGMLSQVGEMLERLSGVASINDDYMKRLRKNSHWKNPYLYKTTICERVDDCSDGISDFYEATLEISGEHWRNGRKCKYGERCWYAHGLHEMRAVQGVGSSQHSPKEEPASRETSPSSEQFDVLMGAYAYPMQPQPFKDSLDLMFSAVPFMKGQENVSPCKPNGLASNSGQKIHSSDTQKEHYYPLQHNKLANGLTPVGSTINEEENVKVKEEELCLEFNRDFQPFAERSVQVFRC